MITPYANELANKARETKDVSEAKELSKLAFEELFMNCQPNQLEFSEFAKGLVLSSDSLWRLILMVPFWSANQY